MSYILDALKKSEKERQRGTVPDLMTTQDVPGEGPKKRLFWPYLIVGALVINAGLLAWWLAGHSGKRNISQQATAPQQYAATAPAHGDRPYEAGSSAGKVSGTRKPAAGSAEGGNPVSGSEITPARTAAPHVNVVRQPRQEQVSSDMQKNAENKLAPATSAKDLAETSSVSAQPAPAVKHADTETQPVAYPAPVKNKLYSLQELPASIRQGLPDFAVSTHLYAGDSPSRMVRINGQLLKEGQFLTAGLKMEEITPEGVIFSYHNYRFAVGLK